ncbi:MAG: ABC transporter substrate-binding protein [Alphaproteobacteria bacterium]|nr:ABC transporter substrate-binding protein [Alphaproteobacteria bacterium]MCY4497723.1 ABC transporter substrate-binding protein [Rhodospirillaceae bacterium]
MNRYSLCLLWFWLCIPATALSAQVQRDEAKTLIVTTWGGAYEAAQRQAYFAPFAQEAGVEVRLKAYNGSVDPLRRSGPSGGGEWDVLDMTEPDALAACAEGLLAPFDPRSLRPAPDGTPARKDFLSGAFLDCGVVHLVYATVLAYDDRAFPGEKPRTVADFFDLQRFPGKRALRRQPIALLEWALLSYGVPISQLYDLLSTERGMTLAFRRLDRIRDQIVWWEDGSEPVKLLERREVVMASGFNGRFFNARVNDDIPVTIIWDGQFLDMSVWAIAKDSPSRTLAESFIGFATRAENMAAFAHLIPYGPTRRSAIARIGLHARSNVPMLLHMPTAPLNLRRAIRSDSLWYARTEAVRQRWFRNWLAQDKGS